MLDIAHRSMGWRSFLLLLAKGFLTGKYRSKEDLGKSVRGNRVVDYLEGKGMRVLAALDEVAEQTGAPLATIALAWTMAQPGITAPIASATSVEQLKQLTAAMHLKLSSEQIGQARRREFRDRSRARLELRYAGSASRRTGTSSRTASMESKCGAGITSRHRCGPIRST